MRRNNTLAAAITATLALTAGAGAYASQFENATASLPVYDIAAPNGAARLYPDPEFDFVGPSYVPAANATGGIPYASELFGSGALIFPTPSVGTGEYMAAVYTIDGTIDKDFEMTFTLDKGRFAAALLGIRSGQQNSGFMVAGLSTGNCTMSDGGQLVSIDQVFRFDSATDTGYPYQVASLGGGMVTFWQLGNKGNCPAIGVVNGTSKVFLSSASVGFKVENASTGAVVSTATIPAMLTITTGYATVGLTGATGSIASKFTTGWRYFCAPNTTAGHMSFGNLVPVFEVKGTTTVAGSDGLLVSVLPASTAGDGGNSFGGFASSGSMCDGTTNSAIYRVNAKGDTVIAVPNAGQFTAGRSYKFDGGGTAAVFPNSNVHTTAYRVTATDTTKNTITIDPALAVNALLHGEAAYDTGAFNTGGAWNTGNAVAATVVGKAVGDAVNNSSFSVLLKASTSGLTLYNNDQIMLLYKLTDLGALAAAEENVKMKVDLKVPLIGVVVNPTRELTVARSVQAVNAVISPTPQTVFISVSSNMTQFKGTGISFDNSYVARIGKLTITDASKATGDKPVKEDGITGFEIDATKVLADSSKLTVTNGQFSASTKLPGKVYIRAGSNELTADEVTQDTQGIWNATWNLNSGELKAIIGANDTYIQIRADGNSQINSNTEDAIPHGKLELKFNKAEYRQDITAEGDLLRIPRDGIVCTVYNVPPPTEGAYGADVVSIRITNDSNVADKIKGTLIDQDGTVLYDGLLFGENELKAGATMRLTNDDLGTLAGNKWDGRAILRILSNLPKMEVMTLIRQQKVPGAPLSNLSTAAKGTSCDNQ